ncbi:MAG: MarR family winged helix-turn-helix transcriptional regulator [Pseudomonadota bacterium]
MMEAKLWNNPCWLTYRLNYLALRYNTPLYAFVEDKWGLSRPEFVVIYSLGLSDHSNAVDIAASSGFPQNTLSRAIHRLSGLGLLARAEDPADGRRRVVSLTAAGRALFEAALPHFVAFERRMLSALSTAEQETLSNLMAKMVMAAPDWPTTVDGKDSYANP